MVKHQNYNSFCHMFSKYGYNINIAPNIKLSIIFKVENNIN